MPICLSELDEIGPCIAMTASPAPSQLWMASEWAEVSKTIGP